MTKLKKAVAECKDRRVTLKSLSETLRLDGALFASRRKAAPYYSGITIRTMFPRTNISDARYLIYHHIKRFKEFSIKKVGNMPT